MYPGGVLPLPLLPFAAAAPALTVEAEGSCPSPAAVEARLAGLAPAAGADPLVARISRVRQGIRLRLVRRADEALLAERTFVADRPCVALADDAALILATWLAAPESGVTLEPPAAPPEASRRAIPAAPLTIAVGLAGGVAAGRAGGLGGTGAPELTVGRRGRAAVARLFAALPLQDRRAPLAGGEIRWRRTGLGLGLGLRAGRGRVSAGIEGGLQAARLAIAGSGFDEDRESRGYDLGARAGGRIGLRAGPAEIFLDLALSGWSGRQRVLVEGAGDRDLLPRLELGATMGLALALRP